MSGFSPFLKKEFFELYRRRRLLLFSILFVFFGILAPASAKLTPALFKLMSEDFRQQGITIGEVTVSAYNSWEQFFGNLSLQLIVFVVVFSGSVTNEFESSSVVPLLAKGLSRTSLILSKLCCGLCVWALGYWLSFSVCLGYTRYYWDSSTVPGLYKAALLWWLFSAAVVCVMFLFSCVVRTSVQVMLCTGAAVIVPYLLSAVKPAKRFLPTSLIDAMPLCSNAKNVSEIAPAVIITAVTALACILLCPFLIRKKSV